MPAAERVSAAVVGTGFGGTIAALRLAREFAKRGKGERLVIFERGTWWTTPVATVQDKRVKTYDFLVRKGQPVQFWSSLGNFGGFIDIFTRCFRRPKNEDGLYDMMTLGKRPWLGFLGGQNDGVSVVRACGVGGGSLVYSNITIRPPDFIFEDERWPVFKMADERERYFNLAREAVGHGVLFALEGDEATGTRAAVDPKWKAYPGLSNIATRSARLNPHWILKNDPLNPRGLKQIDLGPAEGGTQHADPSNALWLDRARVFQTAMSSLTDDFGTVDSSIADINPLLNQFQPADPQYDPESNRYDPGATPANFCERQGRCNIGCLPGARHTLNKQLMRALLGTFDPQAPDDSSKDKPPFFDNVELRTLTDVQLIRQLPTGGYEVEYLQRQKDRPERFEREAIAADLVVLAAGCLGTTEILLRSKEAGGLAHVSERVGHGFSTNGDYIAFLEETQQKVSLVRGPVTTSFGHFNTGTAKSGTDVVEFHSLEDQGIPPALASVLGQGLPLIRSLAKGRGGRLFVVHAVLRWLWQRLRTIIPEVLSNYRRRGEIFKSDEELTSDMMCVVGMGREAAVGKLRLGKARETPLRVTRTDGKKFWEDPIYEAIRQTLNRMTTLVQRADAKDKGFINPFLSTVAGAFKADSIAVSHPLGGCAIGKDASRGVVDEFGRVFDTSRGGTYPSLFVSDGSVVPTALGVNPSLTIVALALRITERMVEDLP